MADAFRGLTIKIGADARPLQSAISSITRSASQAQSQLSKMNKALRFDQGNAAAMQMRLDHIGDKAILAARGASQIALSMRQAAGETLVFSERSGLGAQKLEKVAANTKQAHSAAQKLRSEYNHVDAELAHVYEAAAKVRAESKGISFERALKQVKELAKNMNGTSADAMKAKAELRALIATASMSGTNDISKKFGLDRTYESAKKLISIYQSLRTAQKALNQDLTNMNKVVAFRNAQVQLMAFRAELRQSATEAARFKSELHALGSGGQLASALSQMKSMTAAEEQATAHAKQMAEVYKLMPKSIEAARAKMVSAKTASATLEAKLKSIKTALDKIRADKAFDAQAASSDKAYIKAAKVEQEYAKLKYKLDAAKGASDTLNAELQSMRDNKVKETSAEFVKLKSKVTAVDNAVDRLQAELHALSSSHAAAALVTQFQKLRAEEAACVAQMQRLKAESSLLRGMMNFGTGLRELGYGLYSTLTPAIMIAGRYAIQAAKDIDSSYRDMRKTVNGTEEEFEHLKDAALEFSETHVTTASTILDIEAMGGQLGIQAKNLEAFAEVISNLEIATDIEAEDMAKYVGQLSNIMRDINQDDTAEYTRNITSFSDALVRLGNNSAAQESSIMKVMMRIASLGTISGFTTPQLLAISTAVAATGQGCEAAGTAISKTFSNIEAAVGAGGDTLQAFADVAGMSAQEFADAWNNDPLKAFDAFIAGLKGIDEAGGSVDNTLRSLKINSVRQKQALEGLVTTYDVMQDSLRMSQDAWDGVSTEIHGAIEEAGDAAREAGRKSEGFSGELEMMKNNAKVLASEMATGAVPIIKTMGSVFEGFADSVRTMPDEFKTATVGVLTFLAAIGPAGVMLGTTSRAFASVAKFAIDMQGKVIAAGTALSGVGERMALTASVAGTKLPIAARAATGFGKALQFIGSTGGMLAIAGVAVAAIAIADSFRRAQEQADAFKKSTDGLHDAAYRAVSVMGNAATNVDEFGKKSLGAAKSVDQLIEENGKLVDAMNERSEAAEKEIGQLRDAQRIINRYTNKDLSDNIEAQGQLKAAIELVNGACGTHYQIVDLLNGKIADERGELLETVDAVNAYVTAKTRQIELDQLVSDRASAQQAHEDAALTWVKSKQAVEDFYDTYAAEMESTFTTEQRRNDLKDEWLMLLHEEQEAYKIMATSGDAVATIDRRIQALGSSADDTSRTLESMAKSTRVLYDYFGDNEVEFDNFIRQIEECGVTVDEFGDISVATWAMILDRWGDGSGDMASILRDMGVEVRSMAEQYKLELASAELSFDAFCERAGVGADELAGALHGAGVSASELANIGAEGFDNLMKAADEDIGSIAGVIDALNNLKIDPKNLVFTTEEANEAIDKTTGRLIEFDRTAETVTGTKRYFRFEDDGSLTEITDEINRINSTEASVDTETDAEDSIDELESLYDMAEEGAEGEVTTTTNAESTYKRVDETFSYARQGASGTVRIDYEGNANWIIRDMANTISSMTSTAHTVVVNALRGAFASGGISPRYIRAIPRNAAGGLNGIVTRPTLTNVGWVGEDGAEAILHMRNAGGAIVPLSNRQYVRPFARAVAMEMGGASSYSNEYHITVNASGDGDEIARSITKALRAQELMSGRR